MIFSNKTQITYTKIMALPLIIFVIAAGVAVLNFLTMGVGG